LSPSDLANPLASAAHARLAAPTAALIVRAGRDF
jgi:hypothetical protein